jgi:hypothetical protein
MKHSKKLLIPAICIILLTVSCDKKISLRLPDYSSKIVVNGELNTNSTVKVEVSRSIPIMDATDSTGYLLTDANAELFENGVSIGKLVYFNGFFTLNYKPLAGKKYRLEVSRKDLIPASAEIDIPAAIPSSSTYIDSVGIDNNGFPIGQLTINFKDNGATSNYYELGIRNYDASIQTWFALDFSSDDVIFLNNQKLDNGAYVFSDITFNGQTKSVKISIPFGTVNGSPKFEISIKTFSEEYYRYLQQLRDYQDNSNPFWSADPILLKTNVKSGLGMVGGVYNAKDTIQ